MLRTFRKLFLLLFICSGMAALAQIPGTFPFAFLRSYFVVPCEPGSKAFGVGASTNNTDGVYDFTIPAGCTQISVKAWGGGGGASCFNNSYGDGDGGSGGFAQVVASVSPGQALKVVVGSGGQSPHSGGTGFNVGKFGGPGLYSNRAIAGGYSGVHFGSASLTQANALVIAGGGGAAGCNGGYNGGAGGGAQGQAATGASGGVGGDQVGLSAQALKGEDSTNDWGAGGGGYFGGRIGVGWGAAGGGSAFVSHPNANLGYSVAGVNRTVASAGDTDYAGSAGLGGEGTNGAFTAACNGQNGRVVLSWGAPPSADAVTINSNTTINHANVMNYYGKAVTVATGVTVTVDLDVAGFHSLEMKGTSQLLTPTGKPFQLNIKTNLILETGSKISADGRGYEKRRTYGNVEYTSYGGGSHGGHGGLYGNPSETYGSIEYPTTMGSGGYDGAGGGVLKIVVGSTITLNGRISADGANGGGAGGSIWITTGAIQSSGSTVGISASGGATSSVGGGGGGRIAIYYGNLSGFAINSARVQAYGGTGYTGTAAGGAGTIYAKSSATSYGDLLISSPTYSNYRNTNIGVFGQVNSVSSKTLNVAAALPLLPGTSLSLAGKTLRPDISQATTISLESNTTTSLTAVSALTGLTSTSRYFYVSDYDTRFNSVRLGGAARADFGYLKVDELLDVRDTANLKVYEMEAGSIALDNSALLLSQSIKATSDMNMSGSSKINSLFPVSDVVYRLLIAVGNLNIASGAKIEVDGKGYTPGRIYGNATYSFSNYAGGSHGGYGGRQGSAVPNEIYGTMEMPETAGAGGLGQGYGGGIIKITVADKFVLDGLVSANGTITASYDGGGAGGSIWISTGILESTNSSVNVTASGGGGTGLYHTGGGGGRIAIYYDSLVNFAIDSTKVRAYGGVGSGTFHGGAGTVYSKKSDEAYGDLLIADANVPSYQNTKIGVFGQVQSSSATTLNSTTSLLPGLGSTTLLAGKLLKPDSSLTTTRPLVSSTNTSLLSTSIVTSNTKYFYVVDYESQFRDVKVAGAAKLDIGYLKVFGNLVVQDSANLTGLLEMESNGVQVLGSANIKIPKWSVNGNAVFGGTSITQLENFVVGGNLRLEGSSKLTSYPSSTTALYSLNISAQSMNMTASAKVDVDGKGYMPGRVYGNVAYSFGNYAGGSHGGYGGRQGSAVPNEIYGTMEMPETAGAGGLGQGYGGGIIKITVADKFVLDGLVSANGTITASYDGGGAGGSIWISTGILESTNSSVNVTASGGGGTGLYHTGGGGGRIAIYYESLVNFAIDSAKVRAYGGVGSGTFHGGAGTVYSKKSDEIYGDLLIADANAPSYQNTKIGVFGQVNSVSSNYIYTSGVSLLPALTGTMTTLAGKILKPDITQSATRLLTSSTSTYLTAVSSLSGLTANSKYFYVMDYESQFRNVKIGGWARLDAGYLSASQNLAVQDTAVLNAYHVDTKDTSISTPNIVTSTKWMASGNATLSGSSILQTESVNVEGTLTLSGTAKITSFNPTTSIVYSLDITAGSLIVGSSAKIDMDGKGYLPGRVYGNISHSFSSYAGGSHGGYGGKQGSGVPNEIYGSLERPETAGAGASGQGVGGGIIKITVTDKLTVDGLISANGTISTNYDGGGAGGSIWITAGTIESANSVVNITASGGGGTPGLNPTGGGGGRIAIYYGALTDFAIDSTKVRAYGGVGAGSYHGGAGTIYSKQTSEAYGDLLIANASAASYKNTKIGVFGLISSVSSSSLYSAVGILPNLGTSVLTGKTLKPDVTKPATILIASNTNSHITATASLAPMTSTNKSFYITDYETYFRNVKIAGAAGLEVGLLKASGNIDIQDTAKLWASDIEVVDMNMTGTALLTTHDATGAVVHPLNVKAENLSIATGARIDVTGKGYQPSYTYGNVSYNTNYVGGSHGGYGGRYSTYVPSEIYGSLEQPETAGTGGYGTGYGGGILKLTVNSKLTINGMLAADGSPVSGSGHGAGAGGSIWIDAGAIESSSSTLNISASGGAGPSSNASGGGGGRIAIYYESLNGFAVNSTRVRAYGGIGNSVSQNAGAGTIYSKQSSESLGDLLIAGSGFSNFKNTRIGVFGQVSGISTATLTSADSLLPGFGTSTVLAGKTLKPDISVPTTRSVISSTNGSVTAASTLVGLTVATKYFYITDYEARFKHVKIAGAARVDAGYVNAVEDVEVLDTAIFNAYDIETKNTTVATTATLSAIQSLSMTGDVVYNNATLSIPQWTIGGNATFNGASTVQIESLNVGGTLSLNGTSKIVPYDPTTTTISGVNISAQSMAIAAGARIDANGKGYLSGRTFGNTTTGASSGYSGGSHGGYGGKHGTPNEIYGSLEQPITAGAGGYTGVGGQGGGIIRLNVTSDLTLEGLITANGVAGSGASGEGGGAGGSIWITAGTITSTGSGLNITASGGTAGGGNTTGGGGGRIAVYYGSLSGFTIDTNRVRAYGGTGAGSTVASTGGPGTIYSKQNSETYGDLLIAGPTASNYKNTKIGVFGQVASVSTTTLNANASFPLLPGLGSTTALAGKTLKPDISQPATQTLVSSTNNSLLASSTLAGMTSSSKYFYVTDYETRFKSVKVAGVVKVDVGYLQVTGSLYVQDTASLSAYDIDAQETNISAGLVVLQKLQSSGNLLMSGASSVTTSLLESQGNATLNNSSILKAESVDVEGSFTLNTTSVLQIVSVNVGASFTLNGTSKIIPYDPTTTNIYGIEVSAQTMTLGSGARIDTNGKGYLAGRTFGNTTTGASSGYSGGSHGGYGGKHGIPNEVYGSLEQPTTAGAGGYTGVGGDGGGIIRLSINDNLTLEGLITANGVAGSGASGEGGGAGGSIWITAGTITSTGSGLNITASGGTAGGGNTTGGGGGRIAIYYGSLSGFTIDTNRVRAYGGAGAGVTAGAAGGTGTIYSKQNSEAYGDLLIAGPTTSNHKNTKIGVFGQVTSVSTTTLNAGFPLLPGLGSTTALAGKALKPDISQSATRSLVSSTNSSLLATSTLAGMTSGSKYFYVTDYETQFKNVKVAGVAKVDVGYLYVDGEILLQDTAALNAYDMVVNNMTTSSGTMLSVMQNYDSTGNSVFTGTTLTGPTWATTGNMTLNTTSVLQTAVVNVGGNFILNGTSKIIPYDPTTTNIYGIEVSAQAMTLGSSARIDTNGKGYLSGRTFGNTTTGASSGYSGGSHGGYGGKHGTPNEIYGSLEQPITAGAGGYAGVGGQGGGIIRLNVTSDLTLEGLITANGVAGSGASGEGGGAGGSIWITAGTITSTGSGLNITASGGTAGGGNTTGGGGGRIAVYYGSLSGFTIDTNRVRAYGGAGAGSTVASTGGPGTIYSKQNSETYGDLLIAGPTSSNYKNTRIGVFGQVQSVSSLTLTSHATTPVLPGIGATTVLAGKILKPDITQPGTVALGSSTNTTLVAVSALSAMTSTSKLFYVMDYETTFRNVVLGGTAKLDVGYLNVANQLTVGSGTTLNSYDLDAYEVSSLSASSMSVTRNLNVIRDFNSSAGSLDVAAAMSVERDVVLDGSGTLTLTSLLSHGDVVLTNGYKITGFAATTAVISGVEITAENLNLATGTKIEMNGKGYLPERTLGNTTAGAAYYAGGSHGGYGGRLSTYVPNEVYGDLLAPITAGAGGTGTGAGGGIIRLNVASTLTLNGLVSTDGTPGTGGNHGGGAGGSIWITTGTISSSVSTANITANGGAGTGSNANGGGGGRIAIYYDVLSGFGVNATRVQAFGGTAGSTAQGGAGTVYSKNTTDNQASLLISGSNRFSSYARTKITLTAPLALDLFKIENSAQVRQANSTQALTTTTLEIQNGGALDVPTNSAADYGAWFQYSTLIGGPAPGEY